MKNILYFNEDAFNQNLNKIILAAVLLQSLLDEVNNLKIIRVKDISELGKIVQHSESYIKTKIGETLEPKMFGIFKMKRSAMVEALELPDFFSVNNLADKCKGVLSSLKYLNLDGSNVVLDKNSIEKLRDEYSIPADNTQKVKLLECHKAAAVALNEYNKALLNFGLGITTQDHVGDYFTILDNNINILQDYYIQNGRTKMFSNE